MGAWKFYQLAKVAEDSPGARTEAIRVSFLSPEVQRESIWDHALRVYTLDIIRKIGWTRYLWKAAERFATMYITNGSDAEEVNVRRQFRGASWV